MVQGSTGGVGIRHIMDMYSRVYGMLRDLCIRNGIWNGYDGHGIALDCIGRRLGLFWISPQRHERRRRPILSVAGHSDLDDLGREISAFVPRLVKTMVYSHVFDITIALRFNAKGLSTKYEILISKTDYVTDIIKAAFKFAVDVSYGRQGLVINPSLFYRVRRIFLFLCALITQSSICRPP